MIIVCCIWSYSTYVLGYAMPSLQGCMPCIFVINVVTSTSMQSSSRDVADFRDLVEFYLRENQRGTERSGTKRFRIGAPFGSVRWWI